jgi:hypothetical protein
MCEPCQERYLFECDECGEAHIDIHEMSYQRVNTPQMIAFRNEHDYTTSARALSDDTNEYLCDDCYTSCENCGTVYAVYDNAVDCCVGEDHSEYVRNYSYRPSFFFHSVSSGQVHVFGRPNVGELYMGMEIEVEKMMPIADEFYRSLTFAQRDFMYMKTDGSLSEKGVELVTMPATIEAIKDRFPFEQLDVARAGGARSFYYDNCGFHIHVSRSAFTTTHMWKFAKFQIDNPLLCQTVGQRTTSSYASWHYEYKDHSTVGDGLPSMVKGKSSNHDRYVALNFQPRETVELRYFKGNILRAAILKNVEFVQSIYDYTKQLDVKDVVVRHALRSENYLDWLNKNSDAYPNLYSYVSDSNLINQGE